MYCHVEGVGRVPVSVNTARSHVSVNYCRRDQVDYWHDDGSSEIRGMALRDNEWVGIPVLNVRNLPKLSLEPGELQWEIWLDPRVELRNIEIGSDGVVIDAPCRALDLLGLVLLDSLPLLYDRRIHPINAEYDDTPTDWCCICKDSFPTHRLCEHLYWCNECGDIYGVGDPNGDCACRKAAEVLDAKAR